jgi:DNA repair protein RecO (recombination protein O)
MATITKTQGFVLNTTRFRETSLFATIFAKQHGKLQILAKGCRRPKSKMCGALERFNLVEIIYYKRETKETYTVSDVSVIKDFQRIRYKPISVNAALVMCEFLYRTLPAEDVDIRSYTLLSTHLGLLEDAPESDALKITIQFLLRALAYAGIGPHLDSCVRCHHTVSYGKKRMDFSISGGGIVCENDHDETVIILPVETIRNMQDLYKDENATVDPRTIDDMIRILPDYMYYHLNGLILNSLKQLS